MGADMRYFEGWRTNPPEEYIAKGITNGPGAADYEGVEFSDGAVVIRWLTSKHSTAIFPDWDTFYEIHGHPEYGTKIITYDENGQPWPFN